MAQRRVTLLASAARTADGQGALFDTGGADEFHAALLLLDVTAVVGTLPTLDVYVQIEFPDGSFGDIAAFSQVNVTSKRVAVIPFPTPGGFAEGLMTAQNLAPGSVRSLPLGPHYRVAWKIGGVSPSFTFAVLADLYGSHLPGE